MPTPWHSQIASELTQRIHSGVWEEGRQVPTEKELALEFATSRATVRQALARLRAEGLVAGGRGTPPRVQRPATVQSFDTFISFTDWAHQLGRVPGGRVLEAARRPAKPSSAEALGIGVGEPIVEVIRLRTLDGEPTMLERSTFPLDVGLPLLVADLDTGSIYQTMREIGRAPVRARHVFDAVGAEDLDRDALLIARGSPLLRVRRVGYEENGVIVELADDRYLPQVANFAIENVRSRPSPIRREPSAHGDHGFS